MRITSLALALATVVGLSASAQAANLVVNGGFEINSGSGQLGYNTNAAGWTTNGYNFLFAPGSGDTYGASGVYGYLSMWGTNNGGPDVFTNSPSGGYFVANDGAFGVDPIKQTLSGLVVGKQYKVEFDWAAAQQLGFNGPTTERWDVSLGGQTISTATYSNPNHGFSGWMHESFTFTFDGASNVLSFLAVGTPDGLPPFSLLDGVSATAAVPEPSSWMLMIAGFSFIGAAARRRRTNSVAA